ncbi:hypothetical protein BG011_001604 [Mortierella polycephala]|uniref:HCP-like protein n=1 Tax=Mortierella polycephala TaxID=41804 RepID=A0A9P6U513_9FUNG|nr:hypothetical protein BG011_001604 [Mortierella polycephala]
MNEGYVQGIAYYEGKIIRQDRVKALGFFLRAVNQGHALALQRLRSTIKSRQDVDHDYTNAVEQCRIAAKERDADAQCNLGFMYGIGYGVAKNNIKAAEWYQEAADQGHACLL